MFPLNTITINLNVCTLSTYKAVINDTLLLSVGLRAVIKEGRLPGSFKNVCRFNMPNLHVQFNFNALSLQLSFYRKKILKCLNEDAQIQCGHKSLKDKLLFLLLNIKAYFLQANHGCSLFHEQRI